MHPNRRGNRLFYWRGAPFRVRCRYTGDGWLRARKADAVMDEFYCRSGPNEYGPLTATELRKLAQVGRLVADDEVRRGRQGKWILAANLPGLFTLPIRREELAINEMDVVADLP